MSELPRYLREMQLRVEDVAKSYGLDFFPTHFIVLDYKTMNEVAAYGGFPSRYPHWRYGMEYDRLSKSHIFGLSKIYEMVINNDPCYAYLLEGNSLMEQKMVMAHVMAHNDFFKNNFTFSKTERHMINEMANHAVKVRRAMEKYGVEEIENFIDVCLSIENLIDVYSQFIVRQPMEPPPDTGETRIDSGAIHRFDAKPYMESFINPPEYLETQKEKIRESMKNRNRLPWAPTSDVLNFLIHYAPLNTWERMILETIREEAYYFAPQAMTKIMNEGWATFWHTKMMTEKLLEPSEVINYADTTSGVTYQAKGQLNPYKMGLELFRYIEERWNRGAFGPEYHNCTDIEQRLHWNTQANKGIEKIFEVRRHFSDVTFLDEFFTEDFANERQFFNYDFNKSKEEYVISTREFNEIKQRLLFQLTNRGQPVIEVVDANYHNRSELYLVHRHNGIDLEVPYAKATLENINRIWKRPVNIRTVFKNKHLVLSYDGQIHTSNEVKENEGW
ncbi:SpoVR family protein [Myxococcota bacterium]|nr:SpoVR family protein [Myxococcota bacterium]MBU1380291.1 SpoVR family protein [Myxococcota bacterium]MBU1498636.1 SpoVR family protein [Myxococcota bacterium]